MTAPTAPAPGFYADPLDPSGERWWDGAAWTENIRPAGSVATAPAVTVADLAPEPTPDVQDDVPAPQLVPEPPAVSVSVPSVPQVEPEPVPEPAAPEAAAPEPAAPEVAAPEPAAPEPAAPEPAAAIPAGLYPDPYGQAPLRWWDGQQWTTQTSEPPVAAAFVPVQGVPPTVLPLGRGQARHPATDSGLSLASLRARIAALSWPTSRPGQPSRPWQSAPAWPPSRRVLAGLLVVVLAIGTGVYFLLDGHSADAPKPAALAAAVNLRPGDLPKSWVLPRAAESTASAAPDTGGDAFQRDVDRCTGAPDAASAETFTGSSAAWTRGTSAISSDVTVLRTAALAQQDLRAAQGSQVSSCVSRLGTPGLRAMLARKGVALTGLSMSRLPGAPGDGFALRMKMTVSKGGRTMTVWTDSYGFVRNNVEVGLTEVSTGTAPDRAVAAQALKALRTRANASIPLH